MLTHEEIKKLLSAYCSGNLTSAERAWVDEHLSSCPSCRKELADLKTTLQIIKNTSAAESPTWLTSRIMSNIVEQPIIRNGWLQRLFFPLHIKLPLEILALLIISVTGYYLTLDSDSELKKTAPQLQQQQSTTPTSASPPIKEKSETASAPKAEATKSEPITKTTDTKKNDSLAAVPKPAIPDMPAKSDTNRITKQERTESGAAKIKKVAPASESQALKSSATAATGNVFTPAPAVDNPHISVSLITGLDSLSAKTIQQAVYRAGGIALPTEQTRADRQLTVRIPVAKLDELFAQLEKQARIVERPAVAKSVEIVVIDILW